jgi:hypothetical protein
VTSWAQTQYERKKLHQVLVTRKGGAMQPRKKKLLKRAIERDIRVELRG